MTARKTLLPGVFGVTYTISNNDSFFTIPFCQIDVQSDAFVLQSFKQKHDLAAVEFGRKFMTRDVWSQGLWHFGMSERHIETVNKIASHVSYTEVIAFLISHMEYPCKYLEIGVSSGKNLFQLAVTSPHEDVECYGLDIELFNPLLKRHFTQQHMLQAVSPREWILD